MSEEGRGNLVSPDDLLNAAKDTMLGGREPETWEDWARVINFVAVNAHSGLEHSICKLMVTIYEMPLTEQQVTEIVDFQVMEKQKQSPHGGAIQETEDWEDTDIYVDEHGNIRERKKKKNGPDEFRTTE